MASEPGPRAAARHTLRRPAKNADLCSACTCQQLDTARVRAIVRGERPPDTAVLMNRLIAPVIYRIPFSREASDVDCVAGLIEDMLGGRGSSCLMMTPRRTEMSIRA